MVNYVTCDRKYTWITHWNVLLLPLKRVHQCGYQIALLHSTVFGFTVRIPYFNFLLTLPMTYFQMLVLAETFRKVSGSLSFLMKIYYFELIKPILPSSFLSVKFICELKVYCSWNIQRIEVGGELNKP